ncbi:MAG: alpha/beta fold hydrolase [Rhizobiales bacterium]|nr:alpha/beta fold hydrolase [Hyphomicrobiales bacterium]
MTARTQAARPHSIFLSAPDGLKLHVRAWGPRTAPGLPVVCLPGLARTTADFDHLAAALTEASPPPRAIFALDYRGRGRSDYDRNPANYSFAVELNDLIAALTALEIGRAVFVGTSRGGLLTMLLAAARPAVIAGAILNDIGPVIEPKGLVRIKGYVGKLPQPTSFEDAATVLRRLFGAQFSALTDDDWRAFAERTFDERGGRLVPNYDPRLAETLRGVDVEQPLPALWNEFDALAAAPVTVIRGANSDILSPATVKAMRARHKTLKTIEVPGQGHAPLLAEPALIARIQAFIEACERAV